MEPGCRTFREHGEQHGCRLRVFAGARIELVGEVGPRRRRKRVLHLLASLARLLRLVQVDFRRRRLCGNVLEVILDHRARVALLEITDDREHRVVWSVEDAEEVVDFLHRHRAEALVGANVVLLVGCDVVGGLVQRVEHATIRLVVNALLTFRKHRVALNVE